MPAALPKRLDKSCIKQFLSSFDNVLTDCDGESVYCSLLIVNKDELIPMSWKTRGRWCFIMLQHATGGEGEAPVTEYM